MPRASATRQLWAERAWLGAEAGFASDVLVSCSSAGRITEVVHGVPRSSCPGASVVGGEVCLPGFVNAHSHAFHRALRGVSETSAGTFWTWRELMYRVAGSLDPDSYRELASLVYAEMLLAGYTSVGEFHYLHHGPGGVAYADPNEMGNALLSAGSSAGIRLTLLDACFLQAGVDGSALEGVQLRFGDGSGERWSERVSALLARVRPPDPPWAEAGDLDLVRLGVAAHSVRATPRRAVTTVAALAATEDLPLHAHLSEQRRENEECLSTLGLTPTDLLHDCGALGARTTVVHAIHLTGMDIGHLGLAGCGVCACPTTERDLGDGIGPFSDLAEAGAVLSIGSDSHAVIDPFEETRALELNERLSAERRGLWRLPLLLEAGTSAGSRALGWPPGGLEAGAMADVVGLSLGSLRTAGAAPSSDEDVLAQIIFAASPADLDTVVVGGRVVVEGGEHVMLGPARALADRLRRSVASVLEEPR